MQAQLTGPLVEKTTNSVISVKDMATEQLEQAAGRASLSERKFLRMFVGSVVVFAILAVALSVKQMTGLISTESMFWMAVSTGSVGAAMGMLFALMNDVINGGRLEE